MSILLHWKGAGAYLLKKEDTGGIGNYKIKEEEEGGGGGGGGE